MTWFHQAKRHYPNNWWALSRYLGDTWMILLSISIYFLKFPGLWHPRKKYTYHSKMRWFSISDIVAAEPWIKKKSFVFVSNIFNTQPISTIDRINYKHQTIPLNYSSLLDSLSSRLIGSVSWLVDILDDFTPTKNLLNKVIIRLKAVFQWSKSYLQYEQKVFLVICVLSQSVTFPQTLLIQCKTLTTQIQLHIAGNMAIDIVLGKIVLPQALTSSTICP